MPPETVTLPRMLKPYGYATANIGKLHFLPHANRDHREPHPDYGFDVLEESRTSRARYEDAYRAWVRRQAPEQLDAISPGLPPLAETWNRAMGVHDPVHPPRASASPSEALPFRGRSDLTHTAFVAEQRDGVHPRPPASGPGSASPASTRRTARGSRPRSSSISTTRRRCACPPSRPPSDAAPGRARTTTTPGCAPPATATTPWSARSTTTSGACWPCWSELGRPEDTIVVFTADHGDWLGEHLRHGKGYPALGRGEPRAPAAALARRAARRPGGRSTP